MHRKNWPYEAFQTSLPGYLHVLFEYQFQQTFKLQQQLSCNRPRIPIKPSNINTNHIPTKSSVMSNPLSALVQGTQIVQHLDTACSYFLLNLFCKRQNNSDTIIQSSWYRKGLGFLFQKHKTTTIPAKYEKMHCILFHPWPFQIVYTWNIVNEETRTFNNGICHMLLPDISLFTLNILPT